MNPTVRFLPFLLVLLVPAALAQVPADAAAGAAPQPLTDNQIQHVFITANRGEVVTSQPVLDDLQDAEVRAFAQQMVEEHTRVVERAEALPDLMPEMNPVSMSLTEVAQGTARELEGMDAAMLDRQYIEKQVVLHGHTLAMLDHVLIPAAQDEALRALMEETRPAVEAHLVRAKELHHRMMPSPGIGGGALRPTRQDP